MSSKFTKLSDRLYEYLLAHIAGPEEVLKELIKETERVGGTRRQISPDQGALLTVLAKLINAKKAVEVGTFTGYSAICIGRGLVEGGRLVTCESSQEYADVAGKYFKKAGLGDKITVKLGPALESLASLELDSIDLAFIDADKVNYRNYYEVILPKVRPNGLIIFDNVLWHGAVVGWFDHSADTKALRELNDFLVGDSRVEIAMVPIADGITLAIKK